MELTSHQAEAVMIAHLREQHRKISGLQSIGYGAHPRHARQPYTFEDASGRLWKVYTDDGEVQNIKRKPSVSRK